MQAAAGQEPQDMDVWPAGRAILFMLLVSLAMWGSILALVSSLIG